MYLLVHVLQHLYVAEPVVPNSITVDVQSAFKVQKSHEVSTKEHEKYWQPFELSSFSKHETVILSFLCTF
jgi:hypothetical protein